VISIEKEEKKELLSGSDCKCKNGSYSRQDLVALKQNEHIFLHK
jgi:hypothetical protein